MLIDSFADDWLNLPDALHTRRPRNEQVYVLLDGAFIPGLHRALRMALPREHHLNLLFEAQSSCSEDARDVSPLLMPYVPDSMELAKVLQRCNGWPMVSAISTPESLHDLTHRLAAWCVVKNDGQSFNFRFPDTRRLPGTFNALEPVQRTQLAGPASAWHYIGRDGNWTSLPVPCTHHPAAEDPRLDDDQFAAMVKDSEADEILLLLQDRGRRWTLSHSATHALASAALGIADRAALAVSLRLDWCEACIDKASAAGGRMTFDDLLAWRDRMQA